MDPTHQRPGRTRISLTELREAFDLVGSRLESDCAAYVCRRTGRIHLDAPELDLDEPPPDVEDERLYAAVPDRQSLGHGRRTVLDFTEEALPEHLERVARIFSAPRAFRRFKDLLEHEGKLEAWYAYEAAWEDRVLRAWCAEAGFEPVE